MMKISSDWIWFAKGVFPPIWVGAWALFGVVVAFNVTATKDWFYVVAPLLIAAFSFVTIKKQIWTLADGVWDGGDCLIVKNGGEEDRIPLSNIINVGASTDSNSSPVTLRLANPGKFGSEIRFLPLGSSRLRPFAKNAIVEDLIARVHQARTKDHPR